MIRTKTKPNISNGTAWQLARNKWFTIHIKMHTILDHHSSGIFNLNKFH